MQIKFIILSALLSLAAAKEDHSSHDTESVYTYTTAVPSTHEYAHSSTLATSTHIHANTTILPPKTNYANTTTTATGFTNSTISVKPTSTLSTTTSDLATTTETLVESTTTRAASPSSTNAATGGRSSQFGLVVLGAALAAGFGL
ncbi:hypothetical protein QC761_309570 [Podospora bellae-mahoneyi]|uniref:Uncharacterized protein n=1 Tax=Podospora bellae-mahoneyi TaxID=2093777 RepID=A0ABR0FPN5_9PEZI|nr:hypothetical protein QC761_309570 [Podospora bellae-mahoneyi]